MATEIACCCACCPVDGSPCWRLEDTKLAERFTDLPGQLAIDFDISAVNGSKASYTSDPCPDCGAALCPESGRHYCPRCGYSDCANVPLQADHQHGE